MLAKEDNSILDFWKALTFCHSAIPTGEADEIVFHGPSPDELALLEGSRNVGIFFKERTTETLTVDFVGRSEQVQLLHTLEFSSERRRMSVICRTEDGKIRLYCKGAESVIFERLSDKQYYEETISHIEVFSPSLSLADFCHFGIAYFVCRNARDFFPSLRTMGETIPRGKFGT